MCVFVQWYSTAFKFSSKKNIEFFIPFLRSDMKHQNLEKSILWRRVCKYCYHQWRSVDLFSIVMESKIQVTFELKTTYHQYHLDSSFGYTIFITFEFTQFQCLLFHSAINFYQNCSWVQMSGFWNTMNLLNLKCLVFSPKP